MKKRKRTIDSPAAIFERSDGRKLHFEGVEKVKVSTIFSDSIPLAHVAEWVLAHGEWCRRSYVQADFLEEGLVPRIRAKTVTRLFYLDPTEPNVARSSYVLSNSSNPRSFFPSLKHSSAWRHGGTYLRDRSSNSLNICSALALSPILK